MNPESEEDVLKLKLMIELKEHTIDNIVRESQMKTKEINLIKKELKAKEDQILELTKKTFNHIVSEAGTRNNELELENQALRKELIEVKQKNIEFIQELDEMKANLDSKKQGIKNKLKKHLGNFNSSLDAQNGKLLELQNQIRLDKQRIQGAKNQIKLFLKTFNKALCKIQENHDCDLSRQFNKLRKAVDSNMSKVTTELAAEKVGTLDNVDDNLLLDGLELEEEGSDIEESASDESWNEDTSGDELEAEGSKSDSQESSNNESGDRDETEEEASDSEASASTSDESRSSSVAWVFMLSISRSEDESGDDISDSEETFNDESGAENVGGDEIKEEALDDDIKCVPKTDYIAIDISSSSDEDQ